MKFIESIQRSAASTAIRNKSKRPRQVHINPDPNPSSIHNKKRRKSDMSADGNTGFTQPSTSDVSAQNRLQTKTSVSSSPQPSRPDTRPLNVRNEVIVNSDKRHGETAFSTQPSRPNAPTHIQAQRSVSNRPLPKRRNPLPLNMQDMMVIQTNISDNGTPIPESAVARLSLGNEPRSRGHLNSQKIGPTEDRHK